MNSLAKSNANNTQTSAISQFHFDSHAVRVLSIHNEPWFVAADLCRVLELSNPTKAIMNLDDDEKALTSIQGLSRGNEEANIVSESGMYTLILRCRDAVKPGTIPHRVRKWVTAEVLPAIRKTGSYESPRNSTKKALPGKITIEQQEAVKQLVMNRGKALPKENQAKAMITMWSALKTHFGCSYKEISEDQFTEALSLAARVTIEGEFIGKQESLPASVKQVQFTDDELCALSWLWLVADKMRKHAEITYPALRQLESKHAGTAYDISCEFNHWLRNTMAILVRETDHIGKASRLVACEPALMHLREHQWNTTRITL